jgi:hypothetical protein
MSARRVAFGGTFTGRVPLGMFGTMRIATFADFCLPGSSSGHEVFPPPVPKCTGVSELPHAVFLTAYVHQP